jgi:chromosome segregation protein
MMTDEDGVAVARIDQTATGAQVDTLREHIRQLGNVNLDAIEEETQLEARNEDLIKQVADIDSARAKLTELIEHLNVASEQRFKDIFTAIQAHFAAPDGMFRQLFGGGKAEVKLMPVVEEVNGEKVESDRIDWLESGVEVIAKPPGKEPRTINQLSGGEKTMTAVALLLSIFRSKPSCFCILDEVDAALDDANVERFCGVIRRFRSKSLHRHHHQADHAGRGPALRRDDAGTRHLNASPSSRPGRQDDPIIESKPGKGSSGCAESSGDRHVGEARPAERGRPPP